MKCEDLDTSGFEATRFEVIDGDIALLTLNRPEARNAFTAAMREEIALVVDHARQSEHLRAMVITGAGGSFCAGGDVKTMSAPLPPTELRSHMASIHHWFEALVGLGMPVIAAVDGPAYGAGFNLCLAADFIFATERSSFCQAFAKVGLIPDLSGLYLLPRIVGLQRAKELIFSARTLGAREAYELGIVYELVDPIELISQALAMARAFKGASIPAFSMSKSLLNRSFEMDHRAMNDMEALAQTVCLSSDAHRQAADQFRQKKPLPFSGIERRTVGR